MDQKTWSLVTGLLVLLCATNIYQNRRLHKRLATESPLLVEGNGATTTYLNGSLSMQGRFLVWPEKLVKMNHLGVEDPSQGNGYRLVMAFSDQSCDACRDRETHFAVSLAERIGQERVLIVMQPKEAVYPGLYATEQDYYRSMAG